MSLLTNLLKNYRIILASQSPRRINLLKSLKLDFEVIPANIDENLGNENSPSQYCQDLATSKATTIYKQIKSSNSNEKTEKSNLIIAADTIVVFENQIINKPKNRNDAFNILKKLSNNRHFVFTGISIIVAKNQNKNHKILTDFMQTSVYFRDLSDAEILEYIETNSPMDKAGAYGIQDDYGALFVRKIEGCYNNVIGLPLELMHRMMLEVV